MRVLMWIGLLCLSPMVVAQTPSKAESTEIRAWRDFSRQLEIAGVEVLKRYPQPTDIDRAEGLRYLLQQLGSSIEKELIEQPGHLPLLRIGATTINKWGLDGADAKYQGAAIVSNGSYRLRGKLGSARLFAIQLADIGAKYAAFGALTGDQLQADDEGNFDVLISPAKPANWTGVWLELNSQANNILLREYFSDWQTERPGTYYLERVDPWPASKPVTTEQMSDLLTDTITSFSSRAPQWQGRVEMSQKHLQNKVHMQKSDDQGLSSNYYGSGWFNVNSNQALVIEIDAPSALLWSVQLGNVWWESLDYINHTASFNDTQARPSPDGKYRFVLSHQDPGIHNWLDPAGHQQGALLFRLQKTDKPVNPRLQLVNFTELEKYFPAASENISPDHRQTQINQRRIHAAVRWAP